MKNLTKNHWIVIGVIASVCVFIVCVAVMSMFPDMERMFYYTSFAMLGIGILTDSFIVIGSVVQLIEIRRKEIKVERANTFVLLQLLQSIITLTIGILLLMTLRNGAVAAWIMFLVVSLFTTLEIVVRRYRLFSAGQAEWFW